MNYEEHVSVARIFVEISVNLKIEAAGMLACEALWGAAVHAIDAVSHSQSAEHAVRNRVRDQIVGRLDEKYNLGTFLTNGFTTAKDKLHNHFYTGRLGELDVSENLIIGRAFVNRLLELAEQERGAI